MISIQKNLFLIVLENKLLNLRKDDAEIYEKVESNEYDENGNLIDKNKYVTFVDIDAPLEDNGSLHEVIADPNTIPKETMFPEEVLQKLREILRDLKEHDKDGKYIDYLFGIEEYSNVEIGRILGVSDSFVSRKRKQLTEKIRQRLNE